ncbi:MAG TPA: RDD family protein [Gammaproteobacteria bacterium]|nr:RDD family protein [Gammaproteobacteria bacterium]
MSEQKYAGFWIRVAAALIDTVFVLMIIMPLLLAIYGKEYLTPQSWIQGVWDFLLNYIFPAIAVIAFWTYKSATPGKMILKMKIVDAATGGKLTAGQSFIRYLGYYVSIIPLGLGLIWVGIDSRKQGFHDKIAGTVVIKEE